jgi:hypothetical protein
LIGDAADNELLGNGPGSNTLDGGPDGDFCVNGPSISNCEAPSRRRGADA